MFSSGCMQDDLEGVLVEQRGQGLVKSAGRGQAPEGA